MNFPIQLQSTEKIEIDLSSGATVSLPVCRPVFLMWSSSSIKFDYGKKPVLEHGGEACFAELVILRLFQEAGWDGVWVETYGGLHFLKSMPLGWNLQSEHVSIPDDKKAILQKIQSAAKTTACFDIFVWRGDQFVFCEAKQKGKDKLTLAQIKFIEGALACGIPPESLIIVEWGL